MRPDSLPLLILACAVLFGPGPAPGAVLADRFFISGNGEVRMENLHTGDKADIRYRDPQGNYPAAAQARIDRLFGIPVGAPDHISLRLVSLLDYIEDRYHEPLVINSGYRSPEYNGKLHAEGRLAAKASLHMEGMASDLLLGRALAPRAFADIRALNCCGVGYYHGESIHIDAGPARFWDETTSKVRTDISAHNKRVMASTDRDIYLPGERIALRIARITDYPIGISATVGIERDGQQLDAAPLVDAKSACLTITKPAQRDLSLTIPAGLPQRTRLQLRVDLCDKPFPEMPDRILSNEFLIWGTPPGQTPNT